MHKHYFTDNQCCSVHTTVDVNEVGTVNVTQLLCNTSLSSYHHTGSIISQPNDLSPSYTTAE